MAAGNAFLLATFLPVLNGWVQADVVQCLDGSWREYIRDRLIATTPAPSDPGQLRAPNGAGRGWTFSLSTDTSVAVLVAVRRDRRVCTYPGRER